MPGSIAVNRRLAPVRALALAGASLLPLILIAPPARAGSGNILGGARSPTPVTQATAAAVVGAQQAAAASQQSLNALSRTTQALQAIQNAQTSARNLAIAAAQTVPNGLTPGCASNCGLTVAPGIAADPTLWINAAPPTETVTGKQVSVTVKQTATNAILNWKTFNIGSNTTLTFDQTGYDDTATNPGAIPGHNNWVVLNRIADPSGRPSQILGAIKAEGTVLVIDQNGVIFGGASQVDVHSLVASSLYLFDPDRQKSDNLFLAGYAAQSAAFLGQQSATLDSLPPAGAITIDAGAVIDTGAQGFALIAAPAVTNAGAFSAADGQVVLAAGAGFNDAGSYVSGSAAPAPLTAPQITGFSVGAKPTVPDTILINTGLISAPRGNITLLGAHIEQNGVLLSTTSVQHPGAIVIDAANDAQQNGSLIFGAGSMTAILPDADGQTIPSDPTSLAGFTPGLISVSAGGIDIRANAALVAPGQTIAIASSAKPTTYPDPLAATGDTVLEPGAVLDVAGLDNVELPMSANLLTIPRLGLNELADDPLERSGFLYKQTDVVVDIRDHGVNPLTGLPWVGTPLADLTGYVNQIQQTVDQLLVAGGKLSIGAEGFVARAGSTIDLAGGYVHYLGGEVATTRLVGADGHVYAIGNADPNIPYVGFAGQFVSAHPHWGVTETYQSSLSPQGYYEPDYISGGAGGSLSINAAASFLGGGIEAGALTGELQAASGAPPAGGSFTLQGYNSLVIQAAAPTLSAKFAVDQPYWQPLPGIAATKADIDADLALDVTVYSAETLSAADFSLIALGKTVAAPATQGSTVPNQNASQVASSTGSFTLDSGAALSVAPGGSILIGAPGDVTIDGTLAAPAGVISIESFGSLSGHLIKDPGVNDIHIGKNAVLDVHGLWINDFLATAQGLPASGGAFVNAGKIIIATDRDSYLALNPDGTAVLGVPLTPYGGPPPTAPYTPTGTDPVYFDQTGAIRVARGALFDLESGGRILPTGRPQTNSAGAPVGGGGSLTLETYAGANWVQEYDPQEGAPPVKGILLPFDTPTRGAIDFSGAVETANFAGGGTLTIQAPSIRIGGGPSGAAGEFYLAPDLFTGTAFGQTATAGGGFGSYDLTGVFGGVTVAPGTSIVLRQANLQPSAADISVASGDAIADVAPLGLSPDGVRAPVNLTLVANQTYAFTPEGAQTEYYSPVGGATDYTGQRGSYITASDALLGIVGPDEFARGQDPSLYFGADSPTIATGPYSDPRPTLGARATIVADPGASVSLLGSNDIVINGRISAPGGSITVNSTYTEPDGVYALGNVWLLAGSMLNVAGAFVANATATPPDATPTANPGVLQAGGRVYAARSGVLLNGGQVSIAGAEVVAEAGSVIDVSGAGATIDQAVAGDRGPSPADFQPTSIWSDAGAIDFSVRGQVTAANGNHYAGAGTLFLGSTIEADAGAAPNGSGRGEGGSLTIDNDYLIFNQANGDPIIVTSGAADPAAGLRLQLDVNASPVYGGGAYLDTTTLTGSGLGSLTLQGLIVFSGHVDLTAGRQITLEPGTPTDGFLPYGIGPGVIQAPAGVTAQALALEFSTPSSLPLDADGDPTLGGTPESRTATISAPYVTLIGGPANTSVYGTADGILNIDASEVDIEGDIVIANSGKVNIDSAGVVRLAPYITQQLAPSTNTDTLTQQGPFPGFLLTSGDLSITAGLIYPESETAFGLLSYGADATIRIARSAGGAPTGAAESAGATLIVAAARIVQDGDIQVPFGTLQLGSINPSQDLAILQQTDGDLGFSGIGLPLSNFVATRSLTLGADSVSSVSGAGLSVPFGTTVDGLDWYYLLRSGLPLDAPPQKILNLSAGAIAVKAGATVDLTGGGTIYATEFVPGTGGSRDVLSRYEFSAATSDPTGGIGGVLAGGIYANDRNGAANGNIPIRTPLYYQYPDGQQVYAIVPGAQPGIAYADPDLTTYYYDSQPAAGQSIYLAGAPGLPAGDYTLLPGHYATLPGAYRVTLAPGQSAVPGTGAAVLADGTMLVQGYAASSVGGQRSALPQVYAIESQAVWSSYSEIDHSDANVFFPANAAHENVPTPRLPADAGHLVVDALQSLSIDSAFATAPAAGGRVALADVTGVDIEIISRGAVADRGYLGLDASSLDALDVGSLLIGGVRAFEDTTTLVNGVATDTLAITPTASNLIVANDAADPLVAPEILLTVGPTFGPLKDVTVGRTGQVEESSPRSSSLTIRSGAVIEAVGAVTGQQPQILQLGSTVDVSSLLTYDAAFHGYDVNGGGLNSLYQAIGASSGALLRVSNGVQASVVRSNLSLPSNYGAIAQDTDLPIYDQNFNVTGYATVRLPGAPPVASLSIANGATLGAGASLAANSSGDGVIGAGAALSAPDVAVTAAAINFGRAPAGTPGIIVDGKLLASLTQARNLAFASYDAIHFWGDLTLAAANSGLQTLTLDGPLIGDGGAVTVRGQTVVLASTLADVAPAPAPESGSLAIDAATIELGAGAKIVAGYASVTLSASAEVMGAGAGSLDVGQAALTIDTPLIVAETGGQQSVATAGTLTLSNVAQTTPTLALDQSGGSWSFSAASISSATTVEALSGAIAMTASSGDVAIVGGALRVGGFGEQFFDVTQYAPAGTIALTAQKGDVVTNAGAVLDVSASPYGGDAGSIAISAPSGAAMIGGGLQGSSAAGAGGADFSLDVGQAVSLDPLAARLRAGGFSGDVSIHTLAGDLALSGVLSGANVLLVADGGAITVSGTIDASGDHGGEIGLYGLNGVSLTASARLLARADNPEKLGGDVTLSVSPTAIDGVDAADGSEAVTASGAISVAAGAVIDVTGGASLDPGVSNGTVTLRAPILTGDTLAVSFAGTIVGARSQVMDAYKTWATSDPSTGGQHFDGVVDPAGFFNANGTRVNGTWWYYAPDPNAPGNFLRTGNYGVDIYGDPLTDGPFVAEQIGTEIGGVRYDENGKVVPDSAVGFFIPTTVNADHVRFYQGVLMTFVQNPGVTGPAGLTLEPGIELVNDSKTVNGGNITVASNWNLGAGGVDANGDLSLFYRVGGSASGAPGNLSLRAVGDVDFQASLSDGFFQTGDSLDPAYTVALDRFLLQAINPYVTTAGNFGSSPIVNLVGTIAAPAIPYDLNDPLYRTASNAYEGSYVTYANAWRSFSHFAGPIGGTVTTAPAGGPAPAGYSTFKAYIAAYDSYAAAYTPQAQGTAVLTIAPPVAPKAGDYAAFSDYAAAYQAYDAAYGAYLKVYAASYLPAVRTVSAGCRRCVIPVAPTAPTAPTPSPSGQFGLAKALSNPFYYGANGPGNNPTTADPDPVASADLFPVGASAAGPAYVQSWSYTITSGANLASADPHQVLPLSQFTTGALAGQGDVTIDRHTEYPWIASTTQGFDGPNTAYVIDLPTEIRTGTGSIAIAAGLSFVTLDQIAPGVVYTAGHATPALPSADYTLVTTPGFVTNSVGRQVAVEFLLLSPQNPDGFTQAAGPIANLNDVSAAYAAGEGPNGIEAPAGAPIEYSTPAYPEDGGRLSISAQQDVIGVQNVLDVNENRNLASAPTSIGEYWNAWLFATGDSSGSDQNGLFTADYNPNGLGALSGYQQPAWWINFASFDQGVGALGGGNVDIRAGGTIRDLSVSLPTTGQVSGALTYANADGSRNLPVLHIHGAGDLFMSAGDDLLSGAVYVGRGDGVIRVGGDVAPDWSFASAPGSGGETPSPLQLALQDSRISLTANGSISVGDAISPTQLPPPTALNEQVFDPLLDLIGAATPLESGYAFSTLSSNSGLTLLSTGGQVSYATQPAFDQNGNLNPLFGLGNPNIPYRALTSAGPASLQLTALRGDVIVDNPVTLTASNAGSLSIYAGVDLIQYGTISTGPADVSVAFDPTQLLLGFNSPDEGQLLTHVGDPTPNRLYALHDIANENNLAYAQVFQQNDILVTKATDIRAGHDLLSLNFYGQNISNTDVTLVSAGDDIKRVLVANPDTGQAAPLGNSYSIAGPGFFYIEAGRDLGPFVPSDTTIALAPETGIIAIGDYTAPGATTVNPLLPARSAQIFAFAGVKPGIDYQAVIDDYLDPATATASAPGVLLAVLGELGLAAPGQSDDESWRAFQALSADLQHIVVDRYFFDVLEASGKANAQLPDDRRNYVSGYTMVNTLFPAAYGYTANQLTGDVNGSNAPVETGDFDLRNSTIQTQQGGGIALFAPGGRILVGSASANAAENNPAHTGIITIQQGSIFTFSDGSVEVNQSRVFTEQGGDVVMWSSNGDLDAGRGAKTTTSFPPPSYICDFEGFCYIDPRGEVTGAGVATLQSVPGAPTGDAVLVAPRGTVNAGDAGIRVSGDIYIAAVHVLNADNIQVQGKSFGVPTPPHIDTGALSAASNAGSAATKDAIDSAGRQNGGGDAPSIITVEVVGYGGGDAEPDDDLRRRSPNPIRK